ncbi:MAG: hypothetical protein ACTSUO_06755 [Candidatus Thorarchaeota archaeon]
MATLVIHWGRDTKSDVKRRKNQIEFGLGGRKKLSKQEILMCKELHPDVVILASSQVGGSGFLGVLMYISEWSVDFEKEHFNYVNSLFHAGRKLEDLPRGMVPESHHILLGQLGIELYELSTSRFNGIRLWGERNIDSGEKIHLVRFDQDDYEMTVVYSNPLDANLATLFAKVEPNTKELSIISIEELTPRQAYKIAPSGVSGPTKLIELARANSDSQRRKLYHLLKDIWWGQQASEQIHELTKIADEFDINDELKKIWGEFEKTKIELPKL